MRHRRLPWILLSPFLLVMSASATPQAGSSKSPPQIRWERTLEDALATQGVTSKPILVAVNMDGETASEQIVRDRYRNPEFVAWTDRFICLVASVFRHTPRDYDDKGQRIVCPRLGEVTCGEHIALEPILYDKYLGTKRISPRHAVIQLDGAKTFDLYELFDLRELDRQLSEASSKATAALVKLSDQQLLSRADAQNNRSRTEFESRLAAEHGEASWRAALELIRPTKDAGNLGALRILFVRMLHETSLGETSKWASVLRDVADTLGVKRALGEIAIERLTSLGAYPGSAELGGDAAAIYLVEPGYRSAAQTQYGALMCFHADELWDPLPNSGGTNGKSKTAVVDPPRSMLAFAHFVTQSGERTLRPKDPLPAMDELERRLAELEVELGRKPDDPNTQAAFGRASLALAQSKAETNAPGTQFFLEDARKWLTQASQALPGDASLYLDRARTAYYRSDFEEQQTLAERALDVMSRKSSLPGLDDPARLAIALANPPERIEALRWYGDAAGRLISKRAQMSANVEQMSIAAGAWALGVVAASPLGDETDWQSYASFLGALGAKRDEFAALQEGATRVPESDVLRQAMNSALWNAGRVDLIPIKAEWLFDRNQNSGACAWHAGYAHVLHAEDARRREQPDEAIAAYQSAEQRFRRALELAPQFQDTTVHYLAMCALGRGFAHILAGRREEASRCLPEAIAIRPAVAGLRDGLEREAVDLLDYSLELRRGAKSPVDPLELLAALEKADPKNATWARWIADSELREALRAEGRSERVEMKRYLDVSIRAAERAVAIDDSEDSRKTLAQSLAIASDVALDEQDIAEARGRLAEAAPLLGESAPAADADEAALKELGAKLREKLGAARPRFRPGR